MNCLGCKFYELGRPNAIMHKEGICHRYPTHVNMMKTGWCGEYQPKPKPAVKKTKKKTTKKPRGRPKKKT